MPSGTASPTYDAKLRHIPSDSGGVRAAASRFGMEVTREAVKRGVRISAGSDHVAYGPVAERATLFGELQLLVDSIAMSPTAALLAATRDAARAIGGEPGRQIGTIQKGRYADLVLLSQEPAGGHRQPGSGGAGDDRWEDLAAGAAAVRDCDEMSLSPERSEGAMPAWRSLASLGMTALGFPTSIGRSFRSAHSVHEPT